MSDSSLRASDSVALAEALLTTSPPAVSAEDAVTVAQTWYGATAGCKPLTGERDRNFRVIRPGGASLTLKFINDAETVPETDMQVAVLKHLLQRCAVPVPEHQAPTGRSGDDWFSYASTTASNDTLVRVRAYSFLEGTPGSELKAEPLAWTAVGRAAGDLDLAMADFSHPAAHRKFLWDVCQAPALWSLLDVVDDPGQRHAIASFLDVFEAKITPRLQRLPHQVIHNDLSASNLLTDENGLTVTGVLDFGDMVYAPRIAEIAIAASYQMTQAKAPLQVLDCMLDGYSSVLPLSPNERDHTLDLVLARLTQRMVITAWRARQFPGNRDYILRSHAAATLLFDSLIEPWKAALAQRLSAFELV